MGVGFFGSFTKEELIAWLSRPETRLIDFQMTAQYSMAENVAYEVKILVREDAPHVNPIPDPPRFPPFEEVQARVEQIVGKFSTPS